MDWPDLVDGNAIECGIGDEELEMGRMEDNDKNYNVPHQATGNVGHSIMLRMQHIFAFPSFETRIGVKMPEKMPLKLPSNRTGKAMGKRVSQIDL